MDYKEKKVMTIGMVSELTALSERQIRYYEQRKLVTPERTTKGTRRYSFADVELLVEVSRKVERGVQTYTIKKEMQQKNNDELRKEILKGQINAFFGTHIKR